MAPEAASAILFPGQGVGDESSRELVTEHRPELLELATELAGDDPFARMADGTAFAQPAVYCASIAGFDRLGRPSAEFFAGHSLGEVGALAAAGAIDDEDGVRIVVARGRAMADAARRGEPGAMLAVASDRAGAERLASAYGLVVANENSPEQCVLSGSMSAIDRAQEAARQSGLRAKRLALAGAFHTDAMASGVIPFRRALDEIEFRRADSPVISSVTGQPFGEDVRDALAASLVSPIRWTAVVRRLQRLGVSRYLDVGPGKVLAGLVRRTIEGAQVETLASRESAVA
jgi:malonyl CoA-acyl carrier protein transacylase